MLGSLYFEDRFGEFKKICDCDRDKAMQEIRLYINHINPDYVIYYFRCVPSENYDWYDVGSHSEFFYWTTPSFDIRLVMN